MHVTFFVKYLTQTHYNELYYSIIDTTSDKIEAFTEKKNMKNQDVKILSIIYLWFTVSFRLDMTCTIKWKYM